MKSFIFYYFDENNHERFSLVCFIIYKREDSFHHDLVHTIEGIHFIMDGIHSIIVFNPLYNGFSLS